MEPKSLLLAASFPPHIGGIETALSNIAAHFPPAQLSVICPPTPGSDPFDRSCRYAIQRLAPSRLARLAYRCAERLSPLLANLFLFLPATLTQTRAERITTVQCGHLQLGLVGYLLGRIRGIPYIIYAHGKEVLAPEPGLGRSLDHHLKRWVLRHAAAVLVPSEYTRRNVQAWGVADGRSFKIPYGAELDDGPDTMGNEAATVFGLAGKRVVLTVARLVERKGHDQVIMAFPRVVSRVPNAVYLVVGRGPMEHRLKELAVEHGVSDRIIFAGEVSAALLRSCYRACDAFVMPARTLEDSGDVEGFGLVYLEANACGKPVVAGNSGGISDAVLDGLTGLLVNPWDAAAIVDAIVRLLTDPTLAQRLGEHGRQRVRTEFNWPNTADRIQQVLARIEEGGAPCGS